MAGAMRGGGRMDCISLAWRSPRGGTSDPLGRLLTCAWLFSFSCVSVFYVISKADLRRAKEMPMSPTRTMRAQAQKQNKQISSPHLSDVDRKRMREQKKSKSLMTPWLVVFMLFIVFGSTALHIYFTIQAAPKMK